MSGVYGARERATLTTMAGVIQGQNPPAWDPLGTKIADILRQALPDLDDVTIGRVLVAVGLDLNPIFTGDVRSLWAGLFAAGLQLTEAEWEEERP